MRNGFIPIAAEPRLQRRYAIVVRQHIHAARAVSAGPSAPPNQASTFAATQAVWRFLDNRRITLPLLAEPLLQMARQWRKSHSSVWALIIHDWSVLSYPTHTSKHDCTLHGGLNSRGYDLGTLLLVHGDTGDPIVPLELELRADRCIHSTRTEPVKGKDSRLDNVLPGMRGLDGVLGPERAIHIIDREADSVVHYRDWQRKGRCFLVRAKETRQVCWHESDLKLSQITQQLQTRGQFHRSGPAAYRGQAAILHVAETEVVLDRPGWQHRYRRGRLVSNHMVSGPAITLRLIVSRVCDERGKTLATWHLLSNAPKEVKTATLAQWYYWRWRIESFFKLLKSAGQLVEQWQQETSAAIAKRLLVAAMACTLVWHLQRSTDPETISFNKFLVRLSGRQMKYGVTCTAPSLLAGLWVYLAMLDAIDQYSFEELQAMKRLLPFADIDTG